MVEDIRGQTLALSSGQKYKKKVAKASQTHKESIYYMCMWTGFRDFNILRSSVVL